MNRSEIAVNKFKEGYNCAQSVVFGFADRFHLPPDTLLKCANGFGGGMGRKQEVCGAVSGGIIVLGLLFGRGESDDKQRQEIAYLKVRMLIDAFEKEFSTVSCRRLLDGCELLTEQGQHRFKSDALIERCHSYVEFTVRTLEKIIAPFPAAT